MQARANAMNNAIKKALAVACKTARITTLATATSVLCLSQAMALGLGDVDIESGLNEPLLATIELLDVGNLDPDEISISLGELQDFERAGIAQTAFLFNLRFKVEMGEGNTARVLVTTAEVVTEPYVSFLVSARWPNGGLIREYNLLFDLPGANPEAANPAAPASATSQAPRLAQAAPRATSAATESAQATTETGNATVSTGDTLWDIALRTRPNNSVTPQQMMIALREANPSAFINNNLNRLLTGSVLRIPSQQEIALVDPAAAMSQVANNSNVLSAQLLTGAGAASAAPAAARDELTILSGDQDGSLTGGSSDLASTIAMLENELMLSEENLDRARLENRELTERLSMLEEQIDLLQNIIAIEDERLAQLQTELAQQSEAAARAVNEAREAAASLERLNNDTGMLAQLKAFVQGNIGRLIVGLGGLLVIVLALLAVMNNRRKNALEEQEDLELEQELADEEGEEEFAADLSDARDDDGKRSSLAAAAAAMALMMARLKGMFQRKSADEDDDDFDFIPEQDEADDEEPQEPDAETDDDTKSLLNEMGLDDDFNNLDEALDAVEDDAAEDEIDLDDAVAQSLAAIDADLEQEEEDLTDLASDLMAEAPPEEEFLATPVEAETTAAEQPEPEPEPESVEAEPESVEFVAAPAAETAIEEPAEAVADDSAVEFVSLAPDESAEQANTEEESVEQESDEEEEDEVFEFSLTPEPEPNATSADDSDDDLETFNFNLTDTPDTDESAVTADTDEPDLEVISFEDNSSASEQGEPDIELDLDSEELDLSDLSFDETMVADDEDDSEYQPRTGDECDTKLDLAVAYEAMGDIDGAFEILDEVLADGNDDQKEEAGRLKEKWKDS